MSQIFLTSFFVVLLVYNEILWKQRQPLEATLDSENRRALLFRCANTGRRFVVIFSREKPIERFHVVQAIDEKDLTGQEMPAAAWKPTTQQATKHISEARTPILGFLQRGTYALRIWGRLRGEAVIQKKAEPEKDQARGSTTNEYNMADFDFTGWYCPCCEHGKLSKGSIQFVRCAHCREYVCGGRVVKVDNEHQQFNCHDRCGYSGILGGSTLSSMAGIDFNVRKTLELEGRSGKLPPPRSRLMSGNDKSK